MAQRNEYAQGLAVGLFSIIAGLIISVWIIRAGCHVHLEFVPDGQTCVMQPRPR